MDLIAFEGFSDRKTSALYECMWGGDAFDLPVERTPVRWRGKEIRSKNSYTLAGSAERRADTCDVLVKEFAIPDPALFREKFKQSCGGSGGEGSRIATLHSSALCALLFFYPVSKEHPCTLTIEGKGYTFTESCFEYQNPVLKGGRPSNIDVVLIGRQNGAKGQTVLFLESKFAEYYLSSGKTSGKISMEYRADPYGERIYEDKCLGKMGLAIEPRGSEFFALRAQENCYPAGLKQMISHYIGVRNRCDELEKAGNRDPKDKVAAAIASGAKVLLGEILFPIPLAEAEDCRDAYQEKYEILADILNKQLQEDKMDGKITVIRHLLSYAQLQKGAAGKSKINQFYFASGKGQ